VGIVTRSDLLRAFARSDEEISREIDDLVRSIPVAPHDPVDVAVLDGDVTLAEWDTKTTAELLPELIARVPGVISVSARLRRPPPAVDPDQYGFTRR
jgi:hypothetical protein